MNENRQILRLPAVLAMIGCSKPTVYKWVKQGLFPAPLKIGPKASGWLLSEIHAWIEQRSGARGAA